MHLQHAERLAHLGHLILSREATLQAFARNAEDLDIEVLRCDTLNQVDYGSAHEIRLGFAGDAPNVGSRLQDLLRDESKVYRGRIPPVDPRAAGCEYEALTHDFIPVRVALRRVRGL